MNAWEDPRLYRRIVTTYGDRRDLAGHTEETFVVVEEDEEVEL